MANLGSVQFFSIPHESQSAVICVVNVNSPIFFLFISYSLEDTTIFQGFLLPCLRCDITNVKTMVSCMQIRLCAEVRQSCHKLVLTVAIQRALLSARNNNCRRLDHQSMEMKWVQLTDLLLQSGGLWLDFPGKTPRPLLSNPFRINHSSCQKPFF